MSDAPDFVASRCWSAADYSRSSIHSLFPQNSTCRPDRTGLFSSELDYFITATNITTSTITNPFCMSGCLSSPAILPATSTNPLFPWVQAGVANLQRRAELGLKERYGFNCATSLSTLLLVLLLLLLLLAGQASLLAPARPL